ncbi:3159_t:CDS:2 [Ambispora gerdemannii]|uniref:3159_t:CDS:1 n=1 Tax=Ambispora gerdemannii TaxID=144530 RepID=A0A9N8VTY1_9GLOM|nr:3159_t:CDS:2 [Ambispora gerdemannii]
MSNIHVKSLTNNIQLKSKTQLVRTTTSKTRNPRNIDELKDNFFDEWGIGTKRNFRISYYRETENPMVRYSLDSQQTNILFVVNFLPYLGIHHIVFLGVSCGRDEGLPLDKRYRKLCGACSPYLRGIGATVKLDLAFNSRKAGNGILMLWLMTDYYKS